MDTSGNSQMKIWNDAIKDLYAKITLSLDEYKLNRLGHGDEWEIVAHCMDIVEQEAKKLWKQC